MLIVNNSNSLFRRNTVADFINDTIEAHIGKLEEKRKKLMEELEEIYTSKKEVTY